MNYKAYLWAAIAQSVQRLTTGWMVKRSNLCRGQIFRTRSERPWAHAAPVRWVSGLFPGGKAAEA